VTASSALPAVPAEPRTVSEILEKRLRGAEAPPGLVLGLSVLAHAAFFLLLVLVSSPRRPRVMPFTALPVRVVSPSSLLRPGPPAAAPQPVPAVPPVPVPLPPKGKNVIEKAKQPERVLPQTEKALPLPKKSKEPERDKVAGKTWAVDRPMVPAVELPSAASGAGDSRATGSLNFGASVSGVDVDFPFAYYVEQLQALIGANWLRPTAPDGTACTVTFRIQRSGQITEVKLETSSGIPFFDRAATRALYSANPLPPLPLEFRGEQVGVHLTFK
jgi:TonB family protein